MQIYSIEEYFPNTDFAEYEKFASIRTSFRVTLQTTSDEEYQG